MLAVDWLRRCSFAWLLLCKDYIGHPSNIPRILRPTRVFLAMVLCLTREELPKCSNLSTTMISRRKLRKWVVEAVSESLKYVGVQLRRCIGKSHCTIN